MPCVDTYTLLQNFGFTRASFGCFPCLWWAVNSLWSFWKQTEKQNLARLDRPIMNTKTNAPRMRLLTGRLEALSRYTASMAQAKPLWDCKKSNRIFKQTQSSRELGAPLVGGWNKNGCGLRKLYLPQQTGVRLQRKPLKLQVEFTMRNPLQRKPLQQKIKNNKNQLKMTKTGTIFLNILCT